MDPIRVALSRMAAMIRGIRLGLPYSITYSCILWLLCPACLLDNVPASAARFVECIFIDRNSGDTATWMVAGNGGGWWRLGIKL